MSFKDAGPKPSAATHPNTDPAGHENEPLFGERRIVREANLESIATLSSKF